MKSAFIALALLLTAGCYVSTGSSSQASTGGCGTTPSVCPTTAPPTYASDVAPIMQTYCVSCHGPGGSQSNKPLDSYQGVSNLSAKVEKVTGDCSMPPSNALQPPVTDRDILLGWITCGAPNN